MTCGVNYHARSIRKNYTKEGDCGASSLCGRNGSNYYCGAFDYTHVNSRLKVSSWPWFGWSVCRGGMLSPRVYISID